MKYKKVFLIKLLDVLLIPLFLTIFICDRLILSLMVWTDSSLRFSAWANDTQSVAYSLVRVLIVSFALALYRIWL